MPDDSKLVVKGNTTSSDNTVLFNNQLVQQVNFGENVVYKRTQTPETWTLPDIISTDAYSQVINYPFWFKSDEVIHTKISYSSVRNGSGTTDVTLKYDELIAYQNGNWSTPGYKTIIFNDSTEYIVGLRQLLNYIGASKG
jgi:hypothetical protein